MVVDYYNKDVLLWGIERAGFELNNFLLLESRVNDWLENIKQPTVKQLEKVAEKLHLPFGYLFLDAPPHEEISFPFFRTNNNQLNQRYVSLNVYDTIKIIERRQDWLKDFLLENGNEALDFVGYFRNSDNPIEVANHMRETLNIQELWASQFDTWEVALNYLTERIEDIGIIVSSNGVVGNNTKRKLPVEECRGFVVVDEIVPFMFINNSDSKAAQMFTLVHELAHVWIGYSAGFDFRDMKPANNQIEIFCDKIAAEFLVPAHIFQEKWNENDDFTVLNRFFKVSPIVIARRALDLNYISRDSFFDFYNNYIKQEFHKKENLTSGGNFYATAKKRISPTFAAYINIGVKSGKLLYKDAYKLTGIYGDTFGIFYEKFY